MLVVLLACVAPSDSDKPPGDDTGAPSDTGETADTGESADTAETADPDAAERPVIVAADVYCYYHEVGEAFWNWSASCSVTDPQGIDTIDRAGLLRVLEGDVELVTYALSCDPDAGTCSTSFREDYDDILCSRATAYTFSFEVQDEDDHAAAPVSVTGRAQ